MTLRTFNISNIGTVPIKTPEVIVRHQKNIIYSLISNLNVNTVIPVIAIVRHQTQTVKKLISISSVLTNVNTSSQSMFWS